MKSLRNFRLKQLIKIMRHTHGLFLIQKQVLGKAYLTGVMYTPSTLDNYKNCSYTHSSYTKSEVKENSVEGNNFLKNKELIKVPKPQM